MGMSEMVAEGQATQFEREFRPWLVVGVRLAKESMGILPEHTLKNNPSGARVLDAGYKIAFTGWASRKRV